MGCKDDNVALFIECRKNCADEWIEVLQWLRDSAAMFCNVVTWSALRSWQAMQFGMATALPVADTLSHA